MKRITSTQALQLLEESYTDWDTTWFRRTVREALRDHVRVGLAARKRRRVKR